MSALRLFEERDLPALLSIIAGAQAYLATCGVDQWQNGYPDESVLREDMRLSQGYVLERDGKIAAMATIVFTGERSYDKIQEGAWTTPEPYACIHRVAVNADMRGSGIADELMQKAEEVVRSRGVKGVRIDTHRDNQTMQRMLIRNGYRSCGVIHLEDGRERGAARIAMEKHV